MLASWRAELLVLRRSKVAWVLMAVAPLAVLIEWYVFQFALYLGLTPAQYANFGTPGQDLPSLLPSQFAIITVTQLGESTVVFTLLGAYLTGSDWGRGTIRTALMQGPSRIQALAGQVLGVMTASALSVLACFALSGIASELIRLYVGSSAPGADGPSLKVVGEAVGAGLLTGFAYGALGVVLGTLCRSAAGAVAAALAWYTVVEQLLYSLSIDAGGWLQKAYDAFPGASETTLTSMFGSPGGGATSATYQPVGPWESAGILGAYTLAFLGVALLLVRRQDLPASRSLRLRRPRAGRPMAGMAVADAMPRVTPGVLASTRADLMVMLRWPAMWALVLISPVFTLLWAYFAGYVLYAHAGSGMNVETSPAQMLPTLLPGQLIPSVLNNLGLLGTPSGLVACFLIGALAAGTHWGEGTLTTAVLQGPGRVRTILGQALAVATATTVSIALTFAVAAVSSILLALALTGSLSPAAGPLPAVGHLAAALGAGVVIGLAWAALGWGTATVLKSAPGAFAVIVLWNFIVQVQLDQLAFVVTGPVRILDDLLPDAATNTLTYLYGQVNDGGSPATFAQVAPPAAFAILGAYLIASIALPVVLTRRRDLA